MRLGLSVLFFLFAAPAGAAVPVYQWFPSNEFYFAAPFAQDIYFPGSGKTSPADAWAFGFRAVGNGTGVGRTGGLQLQRLTVSNGSFYLLEMPVGAEYITPKVENKPLRYTAAALVDLGLADTDLFAAPMLTAGLLYQTAATQVPGGLSLSFFYRFTDLDLENAGGRPGTLRPALGFRLGYIFKGFWTRKEKPAP